MAIPIIPAMTDSEMAICENLTSKIAWLGCQFASEDTGLSHLPQWLPNKTMLILTDEQPFADHKAEHIIQQLSSLRPAEVLLDFQRPPTPETIDLARSLVQALPCPVGVPPAYATDLDCPVFLPPVPLHVPPTEYLQPWLQRQIWLEVALDATEITITPEGSTVKMLPFASPAPEAHRDDTLCCHYSISCEEAALRFYLYRTQEDLFELLDTVNHSSVKYAIALFQELPTTFEYKQSLPE